MLLLEIDLGERRVTKREIEASGPVEVGLYVHRDTWRLDPLSPQTPVVFGMGPLAGSGLFGVHRLVFVFKSPMSKTLHVSTVGGVAYKAIGMGARAVALVGMAEKPTAVFIANGEVQFVETQPGDAYRVIEELHQRYGEFFQKHDARALVVGPAAFSTYNGAVVSLDLRDGKPAPGAEDFAARGGPGTVLARGHNVVAIVLGGAKKRETKPVDEVFRRKFGRGYVEVLNEKIVKYRYDPKMGTGGTFGVNYPHYRDLVPLFGYKSIYMSREERIKHADAVLQLFWRPFQAEVFERGKSWYNCGEPCPAVCKKVWRGKKVDYESFHAVGPFIGNYLFEEAVPLVDKIDRYGLDAIEAGYLIAWIFDSLHVGLLKPEEVALTDVPAFDPSSFRFVKDSQHNAQLASKLIDGFVENSTEVLALVAKLGIRKAARELERKFRDRVKSVGVRFRDLVVYVAFGTEGYMTPSFYWAPGLVAPMYVQGRYWSNYSPVVMEPEEFAKSCLERALVEAYVDNLGLCRFHRGWAEPVLPELYALAGVKSPTAEIYRSFVRYSRLAGAEPMPWESKRARELVSTLARELAGEKFEYDDYYEWWVRFKNALDRLISEVE